MSFDEATMNLIEQLGGYDEAQKSAVSLSEKLTEKQKNNVVFMNAFNELNNELLEYRRANNIFEVGDAMVIPSRGNGIFHFNALFSDQDIAEARHATPQEIEAGHRL